MSSFLIIPHEFQCRSSPLEIDQQARCLAFLINTLNTHTRLSHRRTNMCESKANSTSRTTSVHVQQTSQACVNGVRRSATSVDNYLVLPFYLNNLSQSLACFRFLQETVVVMQVNALQHIILVFLQRRVSVLTDADLFSALDTDDDGYSTEKLRRILQSQGSALFQLQVNDDQTFSVRLEPTVGANSHCFHRLFSRQIDLHMRRLSRWKV